jgi:hypothetical protein
VSFDIEPLFPIEGIPEVPLFKPPRRRAQAARGIELDARFQNDYPPEWERCPKCQKTGWIDSELVPLETVLPPDEVVTVVWELIDPPTAPMLSTVEGRYLHTYGVRGEHVQEVARDPRNAGRAVGVLRRNVVCSECLGMGRLKGRVRFEAGHRCVRCHHPYMTKDDAPYVSRLLGKPVLPTPGHWSPCDERCRHGGSMRAWTTEGWSDFDPAPEACGAAVHALSPSPVEAEWRVLTVHHLDGDKANCRWWNLLACCQRCHLELQAKVVMERVYPHPHSPWFRPYVSGYYAFVYLGEELTRPEVEARMDELLALELDPSYG